MGEQSRLNTEISAIQKELVTKTGTVSETDINRQKSNIRFYNELVERKNTKWLSLLDLFENTTPDGISLSSLVPDKNQENWKLEGRARSFKSVQKYLEMLESSKSFSNVLLLSHQNITAGAKTSGVQFSISCKVAN
jgi:Tfp pilus assembly protein PilN